VVLFSTAPYGANPHVVEHVGRAGIAAVVEDGQFVIRRGRLRIPVVAETEVPLLLGGAARFQRGNVLAAIAAAYVQGMRYDDIRAGLQSFFPSPGLTPGRLNVVRLPDGRRVLVDYAHNAHALVGLMETVRALPAARRIGVVTVPGDRRDDDIRAAGRALATLDHVVVREDHDLRGRAPGETAALLCEGLREGGLHADAVEVVLDEGPALERALSLAAPNDLLVALADLVPRTLALVQSAARDA
jgi:cyanophycin synthetase